MTKPQINVTPLIDVLLVLLIIFMVISPLKPSSFKVKLPAESRRLPRDIRSDPLTLVVAIDDQRDVSINRQPAGSVDDASAATEILKRAFAERRHNGAFDKNGDVVRTVFISAPRTVAYGDVARVIDAVKSAGADPISLLIDRAGR
ncbi:MAG: biopolymer transporter ExbD [Pyrinomonadaceae bacterium]